MARRDSAVRGSTFGALSYALGVTAALLALPFLLGGAGHPEIGALVLMLSPFWAAWDSQHIRIRRYQTPWAVGPALLLLMLLCLWIVFFPWYLYVRYSVVRGRIPLKSDPTLVDVFE